MAKRFDPPDEPPLLEGRLTAYDGSGAVLAYSIWRPEPAPDIDVQCHVRIQRDAEDRPIVDRPIVGVDEIQALALACNLIQMLAGRDDGGR